MSRTGAQAPVADVSDLADSIPAGLEGRDAGLLDGHEGGEGEALRAGLDRIGKADGRRKPVRQPAHCGASIERLPAATALSVNSGMLRSSALPKARSRQIPFGDRKGETSACLCLRSETMTMPEGLRPPGPSPG